MLIQDFLFFFLSHCSLKHFFFLTIFGFYAPQTRIHPKTYGLVTITGPAKWHFIPNCGQIRQKFLLHSNISSTLMMNISRHHVWTPYSTKSEGSRRNRLPLTKGGMDVVGTAGGKRKCISYTQKLQMCWVSPHQSKTNPQLHSKVSRAKVGRRN